jgi:hypothetical protein
VEEYQLIRKWLAVGIILLFIGTSLIPSTLSEQTHDKNIITVDNEPGDADYTLIKDAVNHANPGDIIEVYSGMYNEANIIIMISNLTLKGIPYELGSGNDTGKPFIKTSSSASIFSITADNVNISGFRMDKDNGQYVPVIKIDASNCMILNNTITGGDRVGLAVHAINSSDFKIIKNELIDFNTVIWVEMGGDFTISYNVLQGGDYAIVRIWQTAPNTHSTISHNIINDTLGGGIEYFNSNLNISANIISDCNTGVDYGGFALGFMSRLDVRRSQIFNNEIRDCKIGVRLSIYSFMDTPKITQNNFINNSLNIDFYQIFPIRYNRPLNRIVYNNFYDDWTGGPERFKGVALIIVIPYISLYPIFFGLIPIETPWLMYDWHPAQEPYNIPGMT